MYNMNFNLFKSFYYVVYYEGFTSASRKLNVAQSALSYNVKQLELQLNKTLIIRDKKNFELTDDGNNLYENLKNVFSILNNSLIEDSKISKKELTIGMRHNLSDFILGDSIKKIINNLPNVHLNFILYSKLDVKKYEEDYDILIDYEDYTNLLSNANKILLCELNNIFVSGKQLAEKYENVHSLKDLNNCDLIAMNPGRKNGKFQKMCYDFGILFKKVISVNDSMLCKQFIKDNVGICFINEKSVNKELLYGDITKLNIDEEMFKDKIIVAFKNNKKELVEKFINILLKEYEVK